MATTKKSSDDRPRRKDLSKGGRVHSKKDAPKPDREEAWEFKGRPVRVAMSRRANETPGAFKERWERELARKKKLCPPDAAGGKG